MSKSSLREVYPDLFYASIGVNRLGGERLAHSPVRSATTIYLDGEGREVGRVERTFDADPSRGQTTCWLTGLEADGEPQAAYIWL